ncbi:hypothetical protein [Bacillus thuringiensis]|uniref:Uncharacterized protein n=1 Tax=Bacillus thuringiensis subsp. higo TaxID=132266 RepID=A0A9X6QIV6_BACUH|nr:hypothetical protein [Bacillus thuringiensis]OUB39969.1 hypothetical protein BK716_31320 [Bacillus thuringiensis serovar higo]
MVRSKEKVLADVILGQIEMQLEHVMNQILLKKEQGETALEEHKKEFEIVVKNSKAMMNILYPVSQEKTLDVASMIEKMNRVLEEIESGARMKERTLTE